MNLCEPHFFHLGHRWNSWRITTSDSWRCCRVIVRIKGENCIDCMGHGSCSGNSSSQCGYSHVCQPRVTSGKTFHPIPWPVTYVVLSLFPPQSLLLWPEPHMRQSDNCTPHQKPYNFKHPTRSPLLNTFLWTSDSLWSLHITNTSSPLFYWKNRSSQKRASTSSYHHIFPPSGICAHRLCLSSCCDGWTVCASIWVSLTTSALDPAPLPYSRISLLQLSFSPISLNIFSFSLDHFHCIKYTLIFLILKKNPS